MKNAFIGIKVEPELKRAIEEVAERRHRNVSSFIREQVMKDDELASIFFALSVPKNEH